MQRLQLVIIDPDAQVALLIAGQRDLTDAGQDLELIDDVELEIFGERMQIARRGRSAEQDDGAGPPDCF